MKKIVSVMMMLSLLLSAAAFGGAAAYAADIPNITMDPSDEDQQLTLISSKLADLKQPDSEQPWYYTVTDLDHDGNLEFIAASQHPVDRSTNLRIWEVTADRSALTECRLDKDPEESFPDILTDVSDTYFDAATDTWYYMLYDNIIISDSEVYTIKTAVHLKDGVIDYVPYAVEHTVVQNGVRSVSHTDINGMNISAEQYNASGDNAMAGMTHSNTSFEWLKSAEIDSPTLLADSFLVFMGQKAPTETFPVPKPAALEAPEASPAPAPTSAPAPAPAPQPPVYLTVTKNPTNENRTEGDTAYFVSAASAYESLTWTFVSPDGGEYSAQTMQSRWGTIDGLSSTTLSISGVSTDMNGWGTYCTFYYKGQTARTTTAYLYVAAQPAPQPAPSGSYPGTVTDWNYSSVTVFVAGTVTVTIPRSICTIDGDLYYGADATVYWDGSNVTYCYIQGDQPAPTPTYGSMSGTAYEGGGGYAINLSNGSQVYVDAWKCNVEGQFYDGCSAVVYYTDYPSSENIYQADIYGNQGLIIPDHATGFDPDLRPTDEHATGFDPGLLPGNGHATGFGFGG